MKKIFSSMLLTVASFSISFFGAAIFCTNIESFTAVYIFGGLFIWSLINKNL